MSAMYTQPNKKKVYLVPQKLGVQFENPRIYTNFVERQNDKEELTI